MDGVRPGQSFASSRALAEGEVHRSQSRELRHPDLFVLLDRVVQAERADRHVSLLTLDSLPTVESSSEATPGFIAENPNSSDLVAEEPGLRLRRPRADRRPPELVPFTPGDWDRVSQRPPGRCPVDRVSGTTSTRDGIRRDESPFILGRRWFSSAVTTVSPVRCLMGRTGWFQD